MISADDITVWLVSLEGDDFGFLQDGDEGGEVSLDQALALVGHDADTKSQDSRSRWGVTFRMLLFLWKMPEFIYHNLKVAIAIVVEGGMVLQQDEVFEHVHVVEEIIERRLAQCS
jgi:hypothetical protein